MKSELKVALHLWQTRRWILKAHRFKTSFAELDLIFEEASSLVHIVEVKTCQKLDWQVHRVSQHQRCRLMRARTLIENLWSRPVALHLAVVSQGEEVTLIEDICS